ncbi:MAG: Nramp family divalent metal transporter [Saprospiraceae bacterium]
MSNKFDHNVSLSEVNQSVDTTNLPKSKWRRILAFFGPAYLVSVGYMDPGNWATDLAGGSKYGYSLIWVLLMSNLMALLLQSMSARLGIVRNLDLAQANRERFPKPINFLLYILAELAIAATDLAEVLGMAIGIQLLTDLPLIYGVSLTVLDTFLLLLLQRYGIRRMEAFIISLVAVVGISFFIQLFIADPDLAAVAGGFIPSFADEGALYIAIGIIGATVMPHNLYLHSALVQTRKISRDNVGIKRAIKYNFWDTTIALNLAFFVNAAILILAASVFYTAGRTDIAEINQAHELLAPMLGSKLSPILFAVALIAAGQSSTVTGTLAGQIVMEGYLRIRLNPWLRRLITRLVAIIPAVIVIAIYGENEIGALLVFSQVLLSLQLGYAIIPLIHFVSDKKRMGDFAIGIWTKSAAWIVAAILIFLNIKMVLNEVGGIFLVPGFSWPKLIIIVLGFLFLALLVFATLYPLTGRVRSDSEVIIHRDRTSLGELKVPQYERIALALDFSELDERVIAHSIAQGNEKTEYFLIHIVESAASRILNQETGDKEAMQDKMQLERYVELLGEKGVKATALLGYRFRAKEIARLVKENRADLLVVGGHGHSGLFDFIYGETINQVRHALSIPVLVIQ